MTFIAAWTAAGSGMPGRGAGRRRQRDRRIRCRAWCAGLVRMAGRWAISLRVSAAWPAGVRACPAAAMVRKALHPGGDRPLDHPQNQLRLGREPGAIGDAGGVAARRVTGPGSRQVQLPVDQRVPGPRGVAEVDRDLGVLDSPGRAGVLPLHADRRGPFSGRRPRPPPVPRRGRLTAR